MAELYSGEDVTEGLKDEINIGVRYAIINAVNDDLIQNPVDEEIERARYATVDLKFIDYPSMQRQISLTGFEKTSGKLDIPEVGSICMCIFMPSRRALIIKMASGGDTVGNVKTRTIRDLVKNGTLLPLRQGEHGVWTSNSAYSYIRQCAKKIVQTIGTLLDGNQQQVKMDDREIHYSVEHESGTKLVIDADGNIILKPGSNSKIFGNILPSIATDDDALVTRKFLIDFFNTFVQKYNAHRHPYVNVSTPSTTSPTTSSATQVSPTLPDGVSTPNIRVEKQ